MGVSLPTEECDTCAVGKKMLEGRRQRGEGSKPKGRSRVRTEGERGTRLKDTTKR